MTCTVPGENCNSAAAFFSAIFLKTAFSAIFELFLLHYTYTQCTVRSATSYRGGFLLKINNDECLHQRLVTDWFHYILTENCRTSILFTAYLPQIHRKLCHIMPRFPRVFLRFFSAISPGDSMYWPVGVVRVDLQLAARSKVSYNYWPGLCTLVIGHAHKKNFSFSIILNDSCTSGCPYKS